MASAPTAIKSFVTKTLYFDDKDKKALCVVLTYNNENATDEFFAEVTFPEKCELEVLKPRALVLISGEGSSIPVHRTRVCIDLVKKQPFLTTNFNVCTYVGKTSSFFKDSSTRVATILRGNRADYPRYDSTSPRHNEDITHTLADMGIEILQNRSRKPKKASSQVEVNAKSHSTPNASKTRATKDSGILEPVASTSAAVQDHPASPANSIIWKPASMKELIRHLKATPSATDLSEKDWELLTNENDDLFRRLCEHFDSEVVTKMLHGETSFEVKKSTLKRAMIIALSSDYAFRGLYMGYHPYQVPICSGTGVLFCSVTN